MRRFRTVQINVSESYYRMLDDLKNNESNKISRKLGQYKRLSFPEFTNLLAHKYINGGKFVPAKNKQKRRCI